MEPGLVSIIIKRNVRKKKNTKEDEQSDNQIVILLNEQIFSCFLFKIINFLVYSFKKKRILPKGSDTFFYAVQERRTGGQAIVPPTISSSSLVIAC